MATNADVCKLLHVGREKSFFILGGFCFLFFFVITCTFNFKKWTGCWRNAKSPSSKLRKCPNQSICFECSEAETRNTKTWKFRIGYKSCLEALDNLELCVSGRSAKAASHNPSATGAEAVRAQAFSVQNQKADRRSHLDLTTGSEEFPCLPNKKLNLLGTEPKKA